MHLHQTESIRPSCDEVNEKEMPGQITRDAMAQVNAVEGLQPIFKLNAKRFTEPAYC